MLQISDFVEPVCCRYRVSSNPITEYQGYLGGSINPHMCSYFFQSKKKKKRERTIWEGMEEMINAYIILIGISELTGLFESLSACGTMIVQIKLKWRGCLDSDWIYLTNSVFWDTTPYTVVFICQGLLYHPRPRDLQLDAAGRGQLKCDGTRAETRFRLSAKRTSQFKSATGSRGVRISGSNGGYTMFRGSVKGTGYPLHSPVSPSLALLGVTVCHHISPGVYSETSVYL